MTDAANEPPHTPAELEAHIERLDQHLHETMTERNQLRARIAELEASNLHLLWVEGRAYHSRIAQLTRALTGLVTLKDGPRDENYRMHKDDAWERARTALAPCSFCGAAQNNNPWCCNARLTTEEIAERQQQARNKTAEKGKT